MNPKLTIQEKLKDPRVERHLTLEQLAEETGISKSALGKYEADDYKDISPFSIVTLAKYYSVSTDYPMGMTEAKNHPNTGLHDLHLSDDMIALLKSGKLNTRLLCEMALHKDFQRMMVDIEIFVDRIADMRINDMNTVLNATRQQVIEKYNPGENDLYVRTLELAQISEDDYFGHVVHQDIDGIMRDIRDAHRKDALTADVETPAMEAQKQLKTAMSYEGSEDEKKARVFLASLGIDYDTLMQEEFVTVINVLKKSAHLKSPYSQRGKSTISASWQRQAKEAVNKANPILPICNAFSLIFDCGAITFCHDSCIGVLLYYPPQNIAYVRYKMAINSKKAIPGSYKPSIAIFVATNPD